MAKRKAITELHVALTASTAKFTQKMNGVKKNMSGIEKAAHKTQNAMRAMRPAFLAAGAAVAAFGASITALVTRQFAVIDSLAKTSDKLGITTEALAGLRFAAEQTGVASNTLDMAIQRMTRRIAEAAQGAGEARGALAELGLDAKELNRLAPDESFRRIAEAMQGVTTQGDRVRLAMRLFDSEGVALVNTLALGSDGLLKMADDAKFLGLAISRDAAAAVERANDAVNRFKKALVGVGIEIAVQIAPTVEQIADTLTEWRVSINGVADRLGAISRVVAAIREAIEFVQVVGLRVIQLALGYVAGMGRLIRLILNDIQSVANAIPGINIQITNGMDNFLKELKFLQDGVKDTIEDIKSAPPIAEQMLEAQKRIRAEIEKERDARQESAAASVEQLKAMTQMASFDPAKDQLGFAIRERMRNAGMFGPDAPEGYERPGPRPYEEFGPPAPPALPELRGGAALVDSLSNLARGGLSGQADATTQAVKGLDVKVGDLLKLVGGGDIRVMLAGIDG